MRVRHREEASVWGVCRPCEASFFFFFFLYLVLVKDRLRKKFNFVEAPANEFHNAFREQNRRYCEAFRQQNRYDFTKKSRAEDVWREGKSLVGSKN